MYDPGQSPEELRTARTSSNAYSALRVGGADVAVTVGEGLTAAVGVWPICSFASIVAVALARARDGVGAGTVLGARSVTVWAPL